MHVRAERERDRDAVRAVNEAAFGRSAEARLVAVLRAQADPLVSLVAESEGAIVGHIMFSPVVLPEHPERRVMGLAPLAVAPGQQHRGIGSALVMAGLERCRGLGAGAVVVLGEPGYYRRFGFSPAGGFGIACEYDVPPEAFMAVEVEPGHLRGASGKARYHPAFHDV